MMRYFFSFLLTSVNRIYWIIFSLSLSSIRCTYINKSCTWKMQKMGIVTALTFDIKLFFSYSCARYHRARNVFWKRKNYPLLLLSLFFLRTAILQLLYVIRISSFYAVTRHILSLNETHATAHLVLPCTL